MTRHWWKSPACLVEAVQKAATKFLPMIAATLRALAAQSTGRQKPAPGGRLPDKHRHGGELTGQREGTMFIAPRLMPTLS
jgi:hypothetical protein